MNKIVTIQEFKSFFLNGCDINPKYFSKSETPAYKINEETSGYKIIEIVSCAFKDLLLENSIRERIRMSEYIGNGTTYTKVISFDTLYAHMYLIERIYDGTRKWVLNSNYFWNIQWAYYGK